MKSKLLVALMFLSGVCFGDSFYYNPWKQPKPIYRYEDDQFTKVIGVDVTNCFKTCNVCDKPFNYKVEVDSAGHVTGDKTERYMGRLMHKECYEKLVDYLVWRYKNDKEYKKFGDYTFLCSTPTLLHGQITFSSVTFLSIKGEKVEKKKKAKKIKIKGEKK